MGYVDTNFALFSSEMQLWPQQAIDSVCGYLFFFLKIIHGVLIAKYLNFEWTFFSFPFKVPLPTRCWKFA